MAALVQSLPQSTSTVTMLQARPSSSSGVFQSAGQTPQRNAGGRNGYAGGNNMGPYRGTTSSTPIAPYAFTSTPALATRDNSIPFLRSENRTLSAPAGIIPSANTSSPATKSKNLAPSPVFSDSSESDSKSDSAPRLSVLTQPLDLSLSDPRTHNASPAKPSPDRYRRAHRRSETSSAALGGQSPAGSAMPSGSGMATVGHLYNFPNQSASSPSFPAAASTGSIAKDDSVITRSSDQAKRYRRRSMASMSNDEPTKVETRPQPVQQMRSYASVVSTPYNPQKTDLSPLSAISRPTVTHGRSGSDHSSGSSKSSRPSSVSDTATSYLVINLGSVALISGK